MKTKTMTKGDLKRKAQALVELARTGNYSLIQSMLEADFPEELAEFMLDKVQFTKNGIPAQNLERGMDWSEKLELPCEVEDATWFSKIAKKTPRTYCAQTADKNRAVVLALALVTATNKKSRYRTAAAKIRYAAFESLGGTGELPFDTAQMPAVIHILNRGLGAVPNLVRVNLVNIRPSDLPIPMSLLSLPEQIKALRVVSNQPISLADFRLPSSLRILELSAPRVFLKTPMRNSDEKGGLQLQINPEPLEHLDPGVAECLLAEGRDLCLKSLEKLEPQEAEALAGNVGELHFGPGTKVPEAALAKLRQHKSYIPGDLNQIWRAAHDAGPAFWSEAFHLVEGKHLILGGHVLDYATGRICQASQDRQVAVKNGNAFSITASPRGLACRRLDKGTKLWKHPMKGASQIMVSDDLIVLKDDSSISKHSIRNGEILGELALGETSGGVLDGSEFEMGHHLVGNRLFLWSPKSKYTGGKWLVAVNLNRFTVEWRAELPGIAGRGMVTDSLGRLLFCADGKLLRLDSSTGTIIGKPLPLGGSYPVVCKHYADGSIIVGCQKGYENPEMKCFDEHGRNLWSISLGCAEDRATVERAAFFKDIILMPFQPQDGSVIWVIDRKTGVILHEVKQKHLEIGAWRSVACLDDRYILLIGDKAFALYDGLPSSWT